MKRLLLVLVASLAAASCDAAHAHVRAIVHGHDSAAKAAKGHVAAFFQHGAETVDLAGKWQLTMDTPHGVAKGPLEMTQEGGKLAGSWVSDQVGTLKFTGSVEGKAVSFSMNVPNGQGSFGFKGTLDGKKMAGTTEMGGQWSATR